MSQIGIFDAGRHVAPDLPVEAVRIGPPDLDGGEETGLSVQKDSPLVFAGPERDGVVGHTLQDRVRLAAQIECCGGVEEDLLRRQGHPLLRLDDLGLARGSPRLPETTRGHPVGDDRPDRVGRVGDRRLRGLVPPPAPDVPDLHGPLDLGNPGALRPLGLLEQVAIADPLEAHRRERRERGLFRPCARRRFRPAGARRGRAGPERPSRVPRSRRGARRSAWDCSPADAYGARGAKVQPTPDP